MEMGIQRLRGKNAAEQRRATGKSIGHIRGNTEEVKEMRQSTK